MGVNDRYYSTATKGPFTVKLDLSRMVVIVDYVGSLHTLEFDIAKRFDESYTVVANEKTERWMSQAVSVDNLLKKHSPMFERQYIDNEFEKEVILGNQES